MVRKATARRQTGNAAARKKVAKGARKAGAPANARKLMNDFVKSRKKK